MTELRLGDKGAAKKLLDNIHEDFDPGDNADYFRRLLMYKGVVKPEDVLPKDIAGMKPLDVVTLALVFPTTTGTMEKRKVKRAD